MKEYYTTREVAEILKISLETVRRMFRNKQLEGIRVRGDGGSRGHLRVRRDSLENYIRTEEQDV